MSGRRSEHGFWKWLERLALLVAVLGLAVWTGVTGAPALWEWWENRNFDRTVPTDEKNPQTGPLIEEPALKTRDLVGRLSIERLHLNVIVREGADSKTLGLSAGHIPGTALPGHAGNIAIAAHRDTLFRALAKVEKSDVIRLEDPNGKAAYYEVASTKVVKPTDMSVIQPHGEQELTLVTCFPFDYVGSAPERFIVTARPVGSESPSVIRTSAPSVTSPPAARHVNPYRVAAIPYREPVERKTYFTVDLHHSREVGAGVSMSITDTDPENQEVEGWLWLMPERRTVWLHSQAAGDPLALYSADNGRKREVVITKITGSAVTGYLVN
jgi:sortase A